MKRRKLLLLNVLAAALLCCSWAKPAQAASAVIVPVRTEKGVDAEVAEQAIEELTRLIRASGFDPISPGQAEPAAEDAQQSGGFPSDINVHECSSPECAAEYRKLFDAAFAVQLALFADGKQVRSVAVVITESAKAYFGGNAQIEAKDVRAAVQVAYSQARERHVRGAGPWLEVSGTPAGAVVYLDGSEFGRLPVPKRHVDPGMHRLEVRQDNFATQTQTLNIPARVDHEENVSVALTPTASNGALADYEHKLDRKWDYVVGGVLSAVGAAYLAAGIYHKSREGDCANRDEGRCVEKYGDNEGVNQHNVLLGVGAASLALGVGVIGLAPIARIRLRAHRNEAFLSVGGRF